MSTERAAVLAEDSSDLFNRRLMWLVLPSLAVWLVAVFLLSTSTSTDTLSISRDGGLRMTLRRPFEAWMLHLHSGAGALLLVCALVQKRLVVQMHSEGGGGSARTRMWHRRFGWTCAALMIAMALAGVGLAPSSSWDRFELFSIAFAAPWVVWAVAIVISARLRNFRFHKLMSNQMLKGAITVPLSRLVGSFVQRTFPDLGEALGYYFGIFGVVLIILVWEMSDVYAYFVQPCGVSVESRRNKAKGK